MNLNKKYNLSGYGNKRSEAKEMFLECAKDALVFIPNNKTGKTK